MKKANDRLRIAAFALEIAVFMNAARVGSIVGRAQRHFCVFQHVSGSFEHFALFGRDAKRQSADRGHIICDSVAFFSGLVYNKIG